MLKRWGRNGWFLGCAGFPKCKTTMPVPLGVKCPKCKTGEVVPIRARGRGRPFFGCTNYNSTAKCDFRVWQRPVTETCPSCGTGFLLVAGGKKNPHLKCANETCSFTRPYELPDADGEASGDERAPGQGGRVVLTAAPG